MNKAKQKYQQKVIRKYVEFYPTETALLNYIDERKAEGIDFATLVKALLSLEAYMGAISKVEKSATEVTKGLLRHIDEVMNDESE